MEIILGEASDNLTRDCTIVTINTDVVPSIVLAIYTKLVFRCCYINWVLDENDKNCPTQFHFEAVMVLSDAISKRSLLNTVWGKQEYLDSNVIITCHMPWQHSFGSCQGAIWIQEQSHTSHILIFLTYTELYMELRIIHLYIFDEDSLFSLRYLSCFLET